MVERAAKTPLLKDSNKHLNFTGAATLNKRTNSDESSSPLDIIGDRKRNSMTMVLEYVDGEGGEAREISLQKPRQGAGIPSNSPKKQLTTENLARKNSDTPDKRLNTHQSSFNEAASYEEPLIDDYLPAAMNRKTTVDLKVNRKTPMQRFKTDTYELDVINLFKFGT